jgi:hypothetical protein
MAVRMKLCICKYFLVLVATFASTSSPPQIDYLRPEANSRKPGSQKVVIGCQKIFSNCF